MKNKNSKSNSDNTKHLSATKNDTVMENKSVEEITSSDRIDVENLLPCKKECIDFEGSDVEYVEDSKESERLLDYIILDDDDNDDGKPIDEQFLHVGDTEFQLKCEIGEVKIKEESLCSGTESISSNGNQTEGDKGVDTQTLSDATAKEKLVNAAYAATPKEEGGNEKNCDSLVLTLDEKELGEISEAVESKSGFNESQSTTHTESFAEVEEKHVVLKKIKPVDKPKVTEAESTSGIPSSENDTKSSDFIDKKTELNDTPLIKTETNQKVKSNTIEPIPKSRVVWVSNLKRSTKATDLKQHLNKFGKVITTKIVTDGRRCFGYVVLESCKDAANCINNLNDSEYEGAKITIATTKPIVENKNNPKEDEKSKSTGGENSKSNKKRAHSKDSKGRKEKSKSKTIIKITKRRRSPSMDPLTTKFDDKHFSRIKDDRMEREYLREKQEKERLKRRLAEEMKRSRDEMNRLREKEEKQRQRELKLELERKRLRLEKEMLERERREMMQLEEEKCKIEKEKISLMRQKLEMEKSIRDSKRKVTPEKEERKVKKQRSAVGSFNFDKFDIERRRRSSERKDDGRYPNPNVRKSKEKKQTNSFYRDNMSKTTRQDKDVKHQSRRDEKEFLCIPPSPPKLSNDFEIPKRKQQNDSLRSYTRKSCNSTSPSKQNHHSYRKIGFDKPKIHPPPRRDERTNIGKSSDHYGHSGKDQRMPWNSTISSQWKMNGIGSQSGTGFPVSRFPDVNYSSANCNTSRFPQPTFYNPQPINLPPPDYKYYFNHHPSNRKY
ncbi:SAFB-like transcription modulator [Agrilus planipennis]|uniref:SAFB-like transcription modulator n=1 Tax=Agrilus planipennis TaxID=224129 RepID=A0A1W4WMR6_AGRPL|nr:SAFB-like transcription modulator [Agrilus planipennis]